MLRWPTHQGYPGPRVFSGHRIASWKPEKVLKVWENWSTQGEATQQWKEVGCSLETWNNSWKETLHLNNATNHLNQAHSGAAAVTESGSWDTRVAWEQGAIIDEILHDTLRQKLFCPLEASWVCSCSPGRGPQCLSQGRGRCWETTTPRAACVSTTTTQYTYCPGEPPSSLYGLTHHWWDTRYRSLDVLHSFIQQTYLMHPLCAGHLRKALRIQLAFTSSDRNGDEMTHTVVQYWIITLVCARHEEGPTESDQDRCLI